MKPPLVQTPRSKRGFSLMAVVVIFTVLLMAAAAVVHNSDKYFSRDTIPAAKTFIEGIQPILTKYQIDLGSYPSNEQGLSALKLPPSDKSLAAKWQGPYIDPSKELLDPWKKPYHYRCPGLHNPNSYDLWSSGPDGQSGTSDDYCNWKTY